MMLDAILDVLLWGAGIAVGWSACQAKWYRRLARMFEELTEVANRAYAEHKMTSLFDWHRAWNNHVVHGRMEPLWTPEEENT